LDFLAPYFATVSEDYTSAPEGKNILWLKIRRYWQPRDKYVLIIKVASTL
jgi:hypothetical protein